jgi:uncharacterized Zn-finger protein
MADKTLQITIPADEEGYASFQCPYCEQRFKLNAGEIQDSDKASIYCPMCGLIHEINYFYSKEVIGKAMEIAEQEALNMIFDAFKGLERKSRSSSLKFKAGKKPKVYTKEIYENIDELIESNLKCCNKNIKVRELDKLIGVYCSYCGGKEYYE